MAGAEVEAEDQGFESSRGLFDTSTYFHCPRCTVLDLLCTNITHPPSLPSKPTDEEQLSLPPSILSVPRVIHPSSLPQTHSHFTSPRPSLPTTAASLLNRLITTMSQPAPPPGMPTPQQLQQMIALEAQKRGMTVPQFQAFQRQQIEAEAAKLNMSPQQFIQMKQEEARQAYQKQQEAAQQQQQQGGGQGQPGQPQPQGQVQHIPVNGDVEATPAALAVAKFLRSQDLKTRTCIFNGQRKDMFKGENCKWQ